MNNISSIVTSFLCNSCGACYGVCPADAIKFKETSGGYYFPEINKDLCTDCGLCVEVCPGKHFGYTLSSNMTDDPFMGDTKAAYVGIAQDKELYENSQSGGIVSAILAHALDSQQIDTAVVVEMQEADPPRPVVKLVYDSKELCLSQKSVYCPIPLLTFIKELKNSKNKIAVVGLPCHIHGLMNILDKIPRYKKNIVFTIGLVCDRVMTYAGMDYLINKAVPEQERANMMFFRDKRVSGYPGDVHIISASGKEFILSASTRMGIKDSFTPARCRICYDKMNTYSDITVCDPHGLKGIDRQNGESAFIARTEKGQELVRSCFSEKKIRIRNVDYGDILNGQAINNKKNQWWAYATTWEGSDRDIPDYFHEVIHKFPAEISIDLDDYKTKLCHSFSLDSLALSGELLKIADKALHDKEHKKKKRILPKILKTIRKLFVT